MLNHSRRARIATAFVLAISITVPLLAYRREYIVTLNGVRKTGAEVCFYAGDKATDPFALFFAYDHVLCQPADMVLDIPPGLFHVFARHRDGFVSGQRDFFVYRGAPNPERGYESLTTPLEPAAFLSFAPVMKTLRKGESLGVWLLRTETASSTFVPLVDGESTLMVPADRPFVPIRVASGAPVAVGTVTILSEAEKRDFIGFEPHEGAADLVVWAKADKTALPRQPQPEIVAIEAGHSYKPIFSLPDMSMAWFDLLFFKNIPFGPVAVRVHGRKWIPDVHALTSTGAIVVDRDPLLIRPGAVVTVHWGTAADAASTTECDAASTPERLIDIELQRCDTNTAGARPCKDFLKKSLPYGSYGAGTYSFDGVPPGDYHVIVRPPGSAGIERDVAVVTAEEKEVSVPIDSFRFFGAVTVNGLPVRAGLVFETGEARSDDSGRYTASLAGDPQTNLINVILCDGTHRYRFIPADPVRENSAYTIDVHAATVSVSVVGEDNEAISSALVTYAPLKRSAPDRSRFYNSTSRTTDDAGLVSFDDVPSDRAILYCAKHPAYLEKCVEMSANANNAKSVVVQLEHVTARGKVVNNSGTGILAWVDPGGHITEQVTVRGQGDFVLQKRHDSVEHVVYASDQRPLVAFPSPSMADNSHDVVITLPDLPTRAFTVRAPAVGKPEYLGLWIGPWFVPMQVFAYHQESRGADVMVSRNEPLQIRDVAEAGAISVAVAPEPVARSPVFIDPFTLPENASIIRQPVTGPDVTILSN